MQPIMHLIRAVHLGDASTDPAQTTAPPKTGTVINATQPITVLSNTVYDFDAGRLTLNFTEPFNSFEVYLPNVSIKDGS